MIDGRWMRWSSGYSRLNGYNLDLLAPTGAWTSCTWLNRDASNMVWFGRMNDMALVGFDLTFHCMDAGNSAYNSILVMVGFDPMSWFNGYSRLNGYILDLLAPMGERTNCTWLNRDASTKAWFGWVIENMALVGFEPTSHCMDDETIAVVTFLVRVGFDPVSWCLTWEISKDTMMAFIGFDHGTFLVILWSLHVWSLALFGFDLRSSVLIRVMGLSHPLDLMIKLQEAAINRWIYGYRILCFLTSFCRGNFCVITNFAYLNALSQELFLHARHDPQLHVSGRFPLTHIRVTTWPDHLGYIYMGTDSFVSFYFTIFSLQNLDILSFPMAANLHALMANLRFTDKEKAALLEGATSDEISMAAEVKFGFLVRLLRLV
ncbi:hypothetical protein HRI_000913100 [Hibiscus trionum]|uniref:Uncharacterized protein n=1 Tax=Hibiscus trionum TaxID=183268 RepID=A0A9W7LPV4_HIBTR|nr:hypothetical protein HRI_000913100 [Hibiscus trionum]